MTGPALPTARAALLGLAVLLPALAGAQERPQIQLSVSSNDVVVGDTVTFAVRVVDGEGRPRPGATIDDRQVIATDDTPVIASDDVQVTRPPSRRYVFRFDDESPEVPSSSPSVPYVYRVAGTYTATVRVVGGPALGRTAEVEVRVREPLTVVLRVEPERVEVREAVTFEAEPSDRARGDLYRFTFDGKGVPEPEVRPTPDLPWSFDTTGVVRVVVVVVRGGRDVAESDPVSVVVVEAPPAAVGPTRETGPVGDPVGEGGKGDEPWWVLVLAGVALGVLGARAVRARPRRTDRRRRDRAPRVPPPVLVVTPRLEGAPPRGAIQGGLRVRRELRLRRTERPARGTIHTESHTDPADAH